MGKLFIFSQEHLFPVVLLPSFSRHQRGDSVEFRQTKKRFCRFFASSMTDSLRKKLLLSLNHRFWHFCSCLCIIIGLASSDRKKFASQEAASRRVIENKTSQYFIAYNSHLFTNAFLFRASVHIPKKLTIFPELQVFKCIFFLSL